MLSELVTAILVLSLALGLMWALGALSRRYPANPELLRKLLHIGIGCLALSLPWLFPTPWPVLAVLLAGLVLLVMIRRIAFLRCHLAAALNLAGRNSSGDAYFLLSVAFLFMAASDEPLFYLVPLLILTFADAAAALTGDRLGRHLFVVSGGVKSIEGSTAFFAVALVSAVPPLLFLGDVGPAGALVLALLLAVTTTALEAVAGRGLDNIFVPLGAYAVLRLAV